MPVLVVAVTRSLLVVTSAVASPFQMRVDDLFLAIVDNWRRHLWSVVVFHGKDHGLVGLYQTKQEADEVAHEYPHRSVLPPVNARGGKDPDPETAA